MKSFIFFIFIGNLIITLCVNQKVHAVNICPSGAIVSEKLAAYDSRGGYTWWGIKKMIPTGKKSGSGYPIGWQLDSPIKILTSTPQPPIVGIGTLSAAEPVCTYKVIYPTKTGQELKLRTVY